MRIFCEIRVIPQFFDVLEIKFQTEFKWDTNERGGMLQRMIIFYASNLSGAARQVRVAAPSIQFVL